MNYYYKSTSYGTIVKTEKPINTNSSSFTGTVVKMDHLSYSTRYQVGTEYDGWVTDKFVPLTEEEKKDLGITDKKKYTVIYSDFFQSGSHRSSIVKMKHIECEPENLMETIESEGIYDGGVNFILDGHCKQSED